MRARIGAAVGAAAYVGGTAVTVLFPIEHVVAVIPPNTAIPIALAAGLLAAAGGALAVERVEAVRRGRTAIALPAALFVGVVAVVVGSLHHGWDVLAPGTTAAVVAGAGWAILRWAARDHAARRLTSDARTLASLPELADRVASTGARAVNAAIGAAYLLFAIGTYAEGSGWWPLLAVVGLGFLLVGLGTSRRITVTEAGVLFESRTASRLVEWEVLEGYYLGDDLVVLRPEWWRSDLVFDGEAVDREAIDALDRYLPRSRTRTVPASGLVPADGLDSGLPEG